jgi:hypothetical protein
MLNFPFDSLDKHFFTSLFVLSLVVVSTIFFLPRKRRIWWKGKRPGRNSPTDLGGIDPGTRRLMLRDPLDADQKREARLYWCLTATLAALGLIGFSAVLVRYEMGNRWSSRFSSASFSDPLIVVGVFFGAVLTVVAAYLAVRTRTHTESRLAWVQSVRTELSVLLSLIPLCDHSVHLHDSIRERARLHISRLDLLLNPSEPVHRATCALLRASFCFDTPLLDRKVLSSLRYGAWDSSHAGSRRAKFSPERQRALKTRIVRLSHALLKMEWERVKWLR